MRELTSELSRQMITDLLIASSVECVDRLGYTMTIFRSFNGVDKFFVRS